MGKPLQQRSRCSGRFGLFSSFLIRMAPGHCKGRSSSIADALSRGPFFLSSSLKIVYDLPVYRSFNVLTPPGNGVDLGTRRRGDAENAKREVEWV